MFEVSIPPSPTARIVVTATASHICTLPAASASLPTACLTSHKPLTRVKPTGSTGKSVRPCASLATRQPSPVTGARSFQLRLDGPKHNTRLELAHVTDTHKTFSVPASSSLTRAQPTPSPRPFLLDQAPPHWPSYAPALAHPPPAPALRHPAPFPALHPAARRQHGPQHLQPGRPLLRVVERRAPRHVQQATVHVPVLAAQSTAAVQGQGQA